MMGGIRALPGMEAHVKEDNDVQMWKSSNTSRLLPIGRVMNTLLSTKYREMKSVLSQPTRSAQRGSRGLLDQSISALCKHVEETVQSNESLDQVLVPLLEHVVKSKGAQCRKQVMFLLQWLFESEEVFMVLTHGLEKILMEREDHYIILGWCIVVRELIENGLVASKLFNTGKQHRYAVHLFKICCHSTPQLLSIVHKASVQRDGNELPTRLSIAAADCILVFTRALTDNKFLPEVVSCRTMEHEQNGWKELVTPIDNAESSADFIRDGMPSTSGRGSIEMDRERLLWDQLDHLLVLVRKLQMWNKRSRPLHAKGLEHVCKKLHEMKHYRDSLQEDVGVNESDITLGAAVLSACWKHYGRLVLLEDGSFYHHYKEMLEQFIVALQQFTQNDVGEEDPTKKRNALETRTYFLACIALLLGRLDSSHHESLLAEIGSQILNLLFAQLRHTDEDVIDLAANILRAIIFRSSADLSGNVSGFGDMETIISLLIDLLDERDSAARAVVLLIAEYFSINPDAQGLQDLFARLDSSSHTQRRNALDVISELMAICSQSGYALAPPLSQNIAKHLLDRLGDEELTNRVQASKLFAELDPSFVLPALVRFVYSPDARVRSAASDAIVSVLTGRSDPCNVIFVLLDCIRNTFQHASLPKHPGQVGELLYSESITSFPGSRMDIDRIMRLVPKWSITVKDWEPVVRLLLNKMFGEPSNAIVPRFLSQISDHLGDVAHIVFKLLILHSLEQKEVNKDTLAKWQEGSSREGEDSRLEDILFDRLSPLLVLKVLPLRVFNDLNSQELYGKWSASVERQGDKANVYDDTCIAALLINRMCHLYEFKDVRKLAAELTGRLHPQVMLPLVGSQWEHAVQTRDTLKLRACLFAICTSLMIRTKESALHPIMVEIRHFISTVLLWPCLEPDEEVAKAQHGCIDCLALMICAELQPSDSGVDSGQSSTLDMLEKRPTLIEEVSDQPEHALSQSTSEETVVSAVIRSVTCQQQTVPFIKSDQLVFRQACPLTTQIWQKGPLIATGDGQESSIPIVFRLCMANVLISVCQKISVREKSLFANMTLPALIEFVQVSSDPQMKAACLQILFTAVYHLKSAVLPYASDLLNLSIQALRSKGLEEARIAGGKLLASLMSSEEAILNSIVPKLMDAKIVLTNISVMDSSPELRSLSEKLLECMTIPVGHMSSMPKF